MTSDTDKLKQWHVIAKLGELERMYMLGNPMALYEVVMTCNRLNTRIPDWAAEPIKVALAGYYTGEKSGVVGQSNTPLGRYKETLKHHIRADIYRVAMAWVKDKNKYRNLPTKCIRAWYDGELEFISAADKAVLMSKLKASKDANEMNEPNHTAAAMAEDGLVEEGGEPLWQDE